MSSVCRMEAGNAELFGSSSSWPASTISGNVYIKTARELVSADWSRLGEQAEYFHQYFFTRLRQPSNNVIDLSDFKHDHIILALDFIHTSRPLPFIDRRTSIDLLVLADFLQCRSLESELYSQLRDYLFPSNVIDYLVACPLPKLYSLLRRVITNFGYRMLEEPSFLDLAPSELVTFLADDHFVADEDAIAHFVRRYLLHNQGHLSYEECAQVLGTIRFFDLHRIESVHFDLMLCLGIKDYALVEGNEPGKTLLDKLSEYCRTRTVGVVRMCNAPVYRYRLIASCDWYERSRPVYLVNGMDNWRTALSLKAQQRLTIHVRFSQAMALQAIGLSVAFGQKYRVTISNQLAEGTSLGQRNGEFGLTQREMISFLDDQCFDHLADASSLAYCGQSDLVYSDTLRPACATMAAHTKTMCIDLRQPIYAIELVFVFSPHQYIAGPELEIKGLCFHHRCPRELN